MVLRATKNGPIAIDFGSYALRVLQLTGRGKQRRVLDYACHEYPPQADGGRIGRGEVVEALRDLLYKKKFVGKRVVSALGQHDLLVKSIRLPEIPDAELASAIEYEAAERIKGLGEDDEIRYIRSGTLHGESDRQQEVLVLAAKGSVVRDHLELLSELGLVSMGIDAVPCVVFRPFEQYLRRSVDQGQVNAFVDIGQTSSCVVIARGDRMALSRSVDVGGVTFDRLVGTALSLHLEDAVELRRRITKRDASGDQPSTSVDPKTLEAVSAAEKPAWEKLGREIGLCIRYFSVTFRGARPNSVTCVGGGSLDARGLEHLSEATGIKCRVGFPLRHIGGVPQAPGGGDGDSLAQWAVCAGLAMKPMNAAVEKVCR